MNGNIMLIIQIGGMRSLNTIDETIKMAGFGKKKVMSKQIDMFKNRFESEGENLIGVCASMKGTAQLYVSDKRVVLHEIKGMMSNDEKNIPLSSIGSINIKKSAVFATLEIITSGNVATIDDVPVHLAEEIKKIIDQVKSKNSTSIDLPKKESGDLTDQLVKLKDLVDAGILTQEEFDAKKKQLLGI